MPMEESQKDPIMKGFWETYKYNIMKVPVHTHNKSANLP